MAHSLFVSDLHLSTQRPGMVDLFCAFLREPAADAEALYILGDLFDYWVGDDDLADPLHARIVDALHRWRVAGKGLYLLHGNRDFLLDAGFSGACGGQILPDPSLVALYGSPTLLMHGDLLCTDDVRYQAFRAQVRDPEWQHNFLRRSLAERHAIAGQISRTNEDEKRQKTEDIMDVAPDTVEAMLRAHGYPRLIHGHTHRPALHTHSLDGHTCQRWVLNDWLERGGYLRCTPQGCSAHWL
jgi:UDP-2,3-diacylglucosamine hydrolase